MHASAIRARGAAVVLALALGGLAGCGDDREHARVVPRPDATRSARQPPSPTLPPAVDGVRVVYDDLWIVEEGQWWLGSADAYFDSGDIPTFQRLLESVNSGSISITVPGADGRYRTRIEVHDAAPAIARWCEDAAEVSLEVPGGAQAITMGSFETFQDVPITAAGWYRVRYCTEQQDQAVAEDAFVGEDYTTFTGRHLIQIWPAPQAPDQLLRKGSRWAQLLSAGDA